MQIGVLALQGGFNLHAEMIKKAGAFAIEVRTIRELFLCDGLILPGGESTTMQLLLQKEKLLESLHQFATMRPVFGTCAGMILMAKEGWIEIAIQRNAYGRQIASFSTRLPFLPQPDKSLEAVFIRAPRIKAVLSAKVEILAQFQGEPVFVRQGMHYAASFHPELTHDLTVHRLFLDEVEKNMSQVY